MEISITEENLGHLRYENDIIFIAASIAKAVKMQEKYSWPESGFKN